MNYILKSNALHLAILLSINFIGLHTIPLIIKDYLISFIACSIYFIISNLSIIYWVYRFGVLSKYSIKEMLRLPPKFYDYILIAVIFFGSFIFSFLFNIAQRNHLFDFLNTNLGRQLQLPSIEIAKKFRILFTMLLLFSTIILVLAEELFFRIYLFEKQFFYMRNGTWILNGFFWTIYHIFSISNLMEIFPLTLLYSYVYQRRRNISMTLIAHLMINFTYVSKYIFKLYE